MRLLLLSRTSRLLRLPPIPILLHCLLRRLRGLLGRPVLPSLRLLHRLLQHVGLLCWELMLLLGPLLRLRLLWPVLRLLLLQLGLLMLLDIVPLPGMLMRTLRRVPIAVPQACRWLPLRQGLAVRGPVSRMSRR